MFIFDIVYLFVGAYFTYMFVDILKGIYKTYNENY